VRFLTFLVFAASLSAGPITISDSGTFSGSTPTTTFSAPSETWSFAFTVASNPVVSNVIPNGTLGGQFDVPFSGFTYSLNGSAVAVTPTEVTFFSAALGGMFEVCLTSGCTDFLQFVGPQMYTGPQSAPTILTGLFTSPANVCLLVVNSNSCDSAEKSTVQAAGELDLQGGPSSSPVLLDAALVEQVTGTIGGQGTTDYYSFFWEGGAFSATASITGTPNNGASYLFSEGVAGSCSSGGSATLNGPDFTGTIAIGNLAAGQYCIGIDANDSHDPTFAINFATPVSGVPEPSTLVLLLAGLGMVGALRFTRRSRGAS
jgi:hypothetical protein